MLHYAQAIRKNNTRSNELKIKFERKKTNNAIFIHKTRKQRVLNWLKTFLFYLNQVKWILQTISTHPLTC